MSSKPIVGIGEWIHGSYMDTLAREIEFRGRNRFREFADTSVIYFYGMN